MKIETKYEMGQRLYAIHQQSVERPPVKCDACEDGTVLLRGEKYQCPKCRGKKTTQASAMGWVIDGSGHVGKIDAEYWPRPYDEDWGAETIEAGTPHLYVKYMFNSSGSGSVYNEPNLFPSREEAQAECDRRNA